MRKKTIILAIIFLIIFPLAFSACKDKKGDTEKDDTTAVETTQEETTKTTFTKDDYEKAGVNELNSIPVMMYHRIYDLTNAETDYTGGNVDADGYNRTAEAFEADLESYYEQGYRMIRLTDMVDGYIDVEFGKSPIVLTFDDGIKDVVLERFEEDGTPVFDPSCAVAILEKMKEKYPDFNVTATFFVNEGLFENGEDDEKVIKWLVDNGYDVGNHTRTHPKLNELDDDEIEEEVGFIYKRLDEIIPGRYVNIVALPYGIPASPGDDEQYEKIFSGTYEGFDYTTKAALLCSWTRSFSPFVNEFDNTCIRRIRAYDNNGTEFDIESNFEELNDGRRYVSDGNPETIVIKADEEEGWLGETYGREVIRY